MPVAEAQINWRRLAIIYLATIGIPLLMGAIAELFFESVFSLVLLAGLLAIPLAVFFVCRTALAEMERVVEMVAPLPEDEEPLNAVEP
jgi:hypothetical protein